MKNLLLFLAMLLTSLSVSAQKKLINRLLSNEVDSTRKPSFMPIPVVGYNQESGFEFGAGTLYSMYMDPEDPLNRSSNFSVLGSISTKKQYNVSIKSDIYTTQNLYHLIGELKFKRIPFNYYGIGNQTRAIDENRVLEDQFRIQLDAEKSLLPATYTGVSIGFEHYRFTDRAETPGTFMNTNLNGRNGGSVLFLGLSQSYDTRNSNNYPTKGFFGRVSYQYAPDLFSNSQFNGSQIRVKLSNFIPLAKQVVLGLNGIFYSVQGNNIPFYLLPQLGNDEMMRGYYRGRFRDQNLLTAQTELRYRFANRFGVVAFAGTGKVYENGDFSLQHLKPNYGAGARYFYDPAKGLSIRLDYGVGQKITNEPRQSGFYISLAEAF